MSASERGTSAAAGAGSTAPREPEVIRREIEGTREELGETVAAVAEKTDLRKQAGAKKEELKHQASARARAMKQRAGVLAERATGAAPESAQEGAQQARRYASENPLPIALGAAFFAGILFGRLVSP